MSSSSVRVTNLAILLLGLGNAGCSGTVGGAQAQNDAGHVEAGALVACNPLAPPPVTIGRLLGVGQGPSPATTLYVVDDAPDSGGNLRVFVSSGKTLVRKFLDGQGGGLGSTDTSLSFADSETSPMSAYRDLLIEQQGGKTTKMALAPDVGKGGFAPDAGDVPLTVLDGGTIQGFAIENLPNVVTYVADVSNGEVLLIVEPEEPWSSEGERVFYGKPAAMIQYPLLGDNPDCCEDIIFFSVNGVKYTADLVFSPDPGTIDGPSTLNAGSETLTVKLRKPTPTNLDGFTFTSDGM
jgi:hypothetical protein